MQQQPIGLKHDDEDDDDEMTLNKMLAHKKSLHSRVSMD